MKTILWDFDGVILDSMHVRDSGFEKIFNSFSEAQISQLLKYHRDNGGLSRYVKIKYFYNNILGKDISEEEVNMYASGFSDIMKIELTNPSNLILESLKFIKENHKKYNFHIVSGSDGIELKFLCKALKIDHYFITINGSPTPKKQLIKTILETYKYDVKNTCIIGDSINDYDAGLNNNIKFFGYNNENLSDFGEGYINDFTLFTF